MRRGVYSKNSEPVPCLSVSRRGRGGIEMNVGLVGRWWSFFSCLFSGGELVRKVARWIMGNKRL